jgi:hypothetical protein
VAACLVLAWAASGLGSTPDYVQAVLGRLNTYRSLAGMQAVFENTAISAAAQAHADYMQVNGLITHTEDPGRAGFVGVNFYDRMAAEGFTGTATGEVIDVGDTREAVVDALVAAIYHRFVVLDPSSTLAGVGDNTGKTVIDLGRNPTDSNPTNSVFVYPASGQTNIPLFFHSDQEEPDPVAGQDIVGYPVSLQFSRDVASTMTSFTIAGPGGNLPATTISQAPNYAVIPLSQLAPDTTYTVTFIGTANNSDFSRSWSFSTGTTSPAPPSGSSGSSTVVVGGASAGCVYDRQAGPGADWLLLVLAALLAGYRSLARSVSILARRERTVAVSVMTMSIWRVWMSR